MTTDTVPKVICRQGEIDGRRFTVTGVAKGAGMIRPDMATMLAFVMTDAVIAGECLDAILRAAVERTFNRITVDRDTSTNDTVLLLASGAGQESRQPIGIVIVFGVTISAVLTLFVVPAPYVLFAKRTHSPQHMSRIIERLRQGMSGGHTVGNSSAPGEEKI